VFSDCLTSPLTSFCCGKLRCRKQFLYQLVFKRNIRIEAIVETNDIKTLHNQKLHCLLSLFVWYLVLKFNFAFFSHLITFFSNCFLMSTFAVAALDPLSHNWLFELNCGLVSKSRISHFVASHVVVVVARSHLKCGRLRVCRTTKHFVVSPSTTNACLPFHCLWLFLYTIKMSFYYWNTYCYCIDLFV